MLPKATISSDHNGIDNSVMMTGQPFIPRQKRKGRSCMQSKEDQISSSASSISINDGCMLQDVPINVGLTMFQMRLNHMAYKPINIK